MDTPNLKHNSCLKCGGPLYEDIPGVMFICMICGGCSYTIKPEAKSRYEEGPKGRSKASYREETSGVKPKPLIVMNTKDIGGKDKAPSWGDENAAAYRYKNE